MLRLMLGLSLTLLSIGCFSSSSNPATVPVEGVVTYDGKPLADASIVFIPDKGTPASGTSDSEGKFELTTFSPGDGVAPGLHKVTVEKLAPAASADLYAPQKSLIPAKYSNLKLTPLTQEVLPRDNAELKIELQSK